MSITEASPGQYLTFYLRNQAYAVPISTVREINRLSDITSVPQTPSFVSGVMNLRGKVVPIVNLRLKFGMDASEATKETCIIVIEGESGQVGMIVDSVSAVIELQADQIEGPPEMGDREKLAFVMGMGKIESQVIVLVDIVRCLSRDQLGTTVAESGSELAA